MPSPDEQAAATVPLNPQSPWAQLLSDSGEPYYYNETSHETTWETPAEGVSAFRGKEEDELAEEEEEPQAVPAEVASALSEQLQSLLGAAGAAGGGAAAEPSPGGGARISELREENSALKLEANRLEAAAAQDAAEKADLKRQMQDLTAALKKAHGRETETQARLEQLQSEHMLMTEHSRSAASEAAAVRQEEVAAHVKEVQELRAKADYSAAQTQRLQAERSELREEVTRLEARVAEEVAKGAEAVAKGHEHEAASATLSVREAEAAELREALSQCEAAVATQRSKAAAHAGEKEALAQEVAELKAAAEQHAQQQQAAGERVSIAEDAAQQATADSVSLAHNSTACRGLSRASAVRYSLRRGTRRSPCARTFARARP